MTDTKPAPLNYFAPCHPDYNNTNWLTSDIDLGLSKTPGTDDAGQPFRGQKFTVCAETVILKDVLTTECLDAFDKAVKARWGEQADAQTVYNAGVGQFFTRAVYTTDEVKALIAEGNFEEAHKVAQSAIDNYQVGRKASVGPTMKQKIAEVNTLETLIAAKGMTLDELIEKAKNM